MPSWTVRIWGVRSSIPAPLNHANYKRRLHQALEQCLDTWKHNTEISSDALFKQFPDSLKNLIGGETICVEVDDSSSQLILDAGTGARRLGYDMMVRKVSGDLHLFLTGLEWEYIQGWPFFIPGYIGANTTNFYSCSDAFQEGMIRQQNLEHFPVEFTEPMHSKKIFHKKSSGQIFSVGKFEVSLFRASAYTNIFRIQQAGTSMGYIANCAGLDLQAQGQALGRLDFLLFGFSGFPGASMEQELQMAIDFAHESGTRRLALIHYDPALNDEELRELENRGKQYRDSRAAGLDLSFAFEGKEYDL